MNLRFHMIAIGMLAVSSTLALSGQAQSSASPVNEQQAAEDALENWVRDNYRSVLDMVFMNSCDVPKASGEMRWIVCARIIPSESGEPEYVVMVGKGYDGKSFARITRPKGQAVYTQIGNYKREHPTAASSDLIKFIVLETKEGDEKEFPALASIEDELEHIRFSPVLPDILFIDPTEFDISLQALWGNKIEIVMYGPGSSVAGQPHPLLSWVAKTRHILNASFK
ncbi:MAG TPA: hypothetical protein VKF63_12090 [Terracidiphilus sp.]|nr:hypothetical protein [Terracidiphilus sp.]